MKTISKPKKVIKLDIIDDDKISVFAIVCQSKIYKLSWYLNKIMLFDLKKEKDYTCQKKNHYCRYKSDKNNFNTSLYLISNISSKGFLIPSKKNANYFLIIEKEASELEKKEFLIKIKNISEILFIFELDLKETETLNICSIND